jgi:hypothetical protein
MYVMIEWPHFFNKTALLNELPIYAAFFTEIDSTDNYSTKSSYKTQQITSRTWYYSLFGNAFLGGKPVFVYSPTEVVLYDYSNLAKTEITNENLDKFADSYGVIIHDLTKENLSISTIKEILANNAKAAIQAEKILKQIEALKAVNEDFDD